MPITVYLFENVKDAHDVWWIVWQNWLDWRWCWLRFDGTATVSVGIDGQFGAQIDEFLLRHHLDEFNVNHNLAIHHVVFEKLRPRHPIHNSHSMLAVLLVRVLELLILPLVLLALQRHGDEHVNVGGRLLRLDERTEEFAHLEDANAELNAVDENEELGIRLRNNIFNRDFGDEFDTHV